MLAHLSSYFIYNMLLLIHWGNIEKFQFRAWKFWKLEMILEGADKRLERVIFRIIF